VGTATVSAYSGSVEPVTTEVEVGSLVAAITLTADPTSLPETGGEVTLLALVRDDTGQPLPGATVNFRTEAGTLASGGRFITTDENGEATDTLTVSAADAQGEPDDRITVTVEAGGEGGVVEDSVDIVIQSPPLASFTFTVNGTVVSFTDTSSGGPTSWGWDFTNDGSIDATSQNTVHDYGTTPLCPIARLRVANAFGVSEITKLVVIGGSCP
jgi:PKD repeat protein